jgi:hypothetical protein
MPDPLHEDLRHTIHLCWKSLRGQEVFKAIEVNKDLAEMFKSCPEAFEKADDFTPRGQIVATVACGSSANRLCEILAGKSLGDITTNADAVNLSDAGKLSDAMLQMRATDGYVLVRINLLGGGAGHSYIFLSKEHHAGEDLKGYIYQTNVGCYYKSAFDLIAWIDDDKSEIEVDLAKHFSEIVKGFRLAAGFTYQEKYMLSGKPLTQNELSTLQEKSRSTDAARFCIQWLPVVRATASANLLAIRQLVPAEKVPAKKFLAAV